MKGLLVLLLLGAVTINDALGARRPSGGYGGGDDVFFNQIAATTPEPHIDHGDGDTGGYTVGDLPAPPAGFHDAYARGSNDYGPGRNGDGDLPAAGPGSLSDTPEFSAPVGTAGPTYGTTSPSGAREPTRPLGLSKPAGPYGATEYYRPSGPSAPYAQSAPAGPSEPSGPYEPSGSPAPYEPLSAVGPSELSPPSRPYASSGPSRPIAPSVNSRLSPSYTPPSVEKSSEPALPSGPSLPHGASGPFGPFRPTAPSTPYEPSGPSGPSEPSRPSGSYPPFVAPGPTTPIDTSERSGRPRPGGQDDGQYHDDGQHHGDDGQVWPAIRGTPGQDYPVYSIVPSTGFSCRNQPYAGYYGDVDAQCQVFHICQEDGRHDSFLCPNGTVFNQRYFVCDWWYNFDCNETPGLYELNAGLYVVPEGGYQGGQARDTAGAGGTFGSGHQGGFTNGRGGTGSPFAGGQQQGPGQTLTDGAEGGFGGPSTAESPGAFQGGYGGPSTARPFGDQQRSFGGPSTAGPSRRSQGSYGQSVDFETSGPRTDRPASTIEPSGGYGTGGYDNTDSAYGQTHTDSGYKQTQTDNGYGQTQTDSGYGSTSGPGFTGQTDDGYAVTGKPGIGRHANAGVSVNGRPGGGRASRPSSYGGAPASSFGSASDDYSSGGDYTTGAGKTTESGFGSTGQSAPTRDLPSPYHRNGADSNEGQTKYPNYY